MPLVEQTSYGTGGLCADPDSVVLVGCYCIINQCCICSAKVTSVDNLVGQPYHQQRGLLDRDRQRHRSRSGKPSPTLKPQTAPNTTGFYLLLVLLVYATGRAAKFQILIAGVTISPL